MCEYQDEGGYCYWRDVRVPQLEGERDTALTALAQTEQAMKTQDETHHRCEKEMDERLAQAERERNDTESNYRVMKGWYEQARAEGARLRVENRRLHDELASEWGG